MFLWFRDMRSAFAAGCWVVSGSVYIHIVLVLYLRVCVYKIIFGVYVMRARIACYMIICMYILKPSV